MNSRDTSGLWEKKEKTEAPDRATGVAPPPRVKRAPVAPVEAAPKPVPVQAPPPAEQSQPESRPASIEPAKVGDTKVLALSFTSDQMDWIRKTSTKRGLWAGEFFEDLFHVHKATLAASGVPPRRRRRNSNYTGTRFKLSIDVFNDFAALAVELGTSNAALGRAVVEAARQ